MALQLLGMAHHPHRIQMLDALRYMVVWLPAILMVAHVALHIMGLDPPKSPPLHETNSTLPDSSPM